MKINKRTMLKTSISLILGFIMSFSLPKTLFSQDEKPKLAIAKIEKLTSELVDHLEKIALEDGLIVRSGQKQLLFDKFLNANYEALAEHYTIIDDHWNPN